MAAFGIELGTVVSCHLCSQPRLNQLGVLVVAIELGTVVGCNLCSLSVLNQLEMLIVAFGVVLVPHQNLASCAQFAAHVHPELAGRF